ncbi:MAG: thioredoxin domain-containing protein [Candidatus Andeanibacterium colombiense]|uniref:Thioredoxin domain-containing protein n=1 Tax=Candidatus Andeanibacterium colombiense TaxID=3121345 RepID=A0AAJ6BNL1_9SPHN|nr:MAG: thioredoxin domain-containing protein [Sphingomonadaceae bacterium]
MPKDTLIALRRLFALALALPFALALASCGGDKAADESTDLPKGEPIAAIAPPAGQQWGDIASETPDGGFVIGNPNAPLKLVEYASHTCSHCAEFSVKGSGALRDKYVASGVVSYEIRNLIRDPIDLTIATLARCNGPAAFHPLADQAWANLAALFDTVNKNTAEYKAAMDKTGAARFQGLAQAAGLFDFFAARGLSKDQAMTCLADTKKITAIVEKSDKDSNDKQLTGTPTFFLNGKRFEGTTWEVVEPILQNAGAR